MSNCIASYFMQLWSQAFRHLPLSKHTWQQVEGVALRYPDYKSCNSVLTEKSDDRFYCLNGCFGQSFFPPATERGSAWHKWILKRKFRAIFYCAKCWRTRHYCYMAPEKGSSGIAKYEEVVLVLKHRNGDIWAKNWKRLFFSHKIWMFLSTGAEQYL